VNTVSSGSGRKKKIYNANKPKTRFMPFVFCSSLNRNPKVSTSEVIASFSGFLQSAVAVADLFSYPPPPP